MNRTWSENDNHIRFHSCHCVDPSNRTLCHGYNRHGDLCGSFDACRVSKYFNFKKINKKLIQHNDLSPLHLHCTRSQLISTTQNKLRSCYKLLPGSEWLTTKNHWSVEWAWITASFPQPLKLINSSNSWAVLYSTLCFRPGTFLSLEVTASPWLHLQPLHWTRTILSISPQDPWFRVHSTHQWFSKC